MTAREGGQKPESTTSTDLQVSHQQFLEVTMKIELDAHTGQLHILTIITTRIDSDIKRGHLINPGMVTDKHHSYYSPKPQNQYNQVDHHFNNSNNLQHVTPNMSVLNASKLLGSLQSQIIGLHSQPQQQATLNLINLFDGANKAEFAT